MAYTGVYVFGDSLVDSGNVLKLAELYGDLTFSDLPDGAPTADLGYYDGRFTDGLTFADLLANKAVGQVSHPTFPFGYVDPWTGTEIAPWASDPNGISLNFAYGGAQVRGGDEAGLDLDEQTDAFKDAVDGDAPPGALYVVTMGGNDVRNLAPVTGTPNGDVTGAHAALDKVADQMISELGQLITSGARNFLITGIADVGLIPDYDIDHSGMLDATEQARAEAGTAYSAYLDMLIRTEVVPALQAKGATVTYVSMTEGLNAILPTLETLHGLAPGTLTTDLLAHHDLVFFDDIHPTAQVHALFGSYAQTQLAGTPWVETLPLTGADVDYSLTASIAVGGEVDKMVIALVADTQYRFDMLGMSSLGTAGSLADPTVSLLTPGGTMVASDADSGAGFDASLSFTVASSGNYTLQLSAVGTITGAYALHASVVGGAAMQAGNSYTVNSAATLVLEGAGGTGQDVVKASVSYALAAGSEIEQLTTTNAKGKTAVDLTGNEFAQQIIGNAGANVLDGKGGADTLTGGAGKDVFVLGTGGIDRITDYANGDLVDVGQALAVAPGTNVVSGGYLRVTTSGLVQVDANGGGDQWVTLGTINGSGAVSVRYLSGGAQATLSVNRVAETYALMAAGVAAAGYAVTAVSEPLASDTQLSVVPAPETMTLMPAESFASGAVARVVDLSGLENVVARTAVADGAHHAAIVERVAFEPASLAHGDTGAALLEATELAPQVAAPGPAMATHVAADVALIVADAIGSGGLDIAAMLDALPAAAHVPDIAASLADLASFAPAMPLVGLELLAVHADALVTV